MARHIDLNNENSFAGITRIEASESGNAERIVIPDTELLFSARFKKVGSDLILTGEDGTKFVVAGYFDNIKRPDLAAPGGAFLSGELVERLAGPENPGQYAQVGAPAGAAVIGRVERLGGSATVQRANGVVEELNIGDNIRQGDIVETRAGSTLGLSFVDGTAFNMGATARMAIGELVYDASSTSNSAVFSLVKGAISFVAGQAAKTGDMRVDTPVASMGIRGTSVNTNIVTDVNGQTVSVTYSLMQDPDGRIGAFSIIDPTTRAVIGTITTTDSVFTVTPTAAGLNALANPKTAQEIAQELAVAQALFPIFLANPANFLTQPPPPDQPKAPPSGGSSTPPGGSTQPLPQTPLQQNGPSGGENNGNNGNNNGNNQQGGTTPIEVVLPPLNAPSVFADIPANLVEAVRLGDAGANTSVAHITKIDLDGTVTFSPIGWQDVGNGIFVTFGTYGAAAFNTGTASVGSLLGAGWTNLGGGIFQKNVISSATGLSETIRVTIGADTLTYALNNTKADGLGPGEHPTETFSIVVVDNDGQTASTTVVYTVDGRNDPPDLSPDPEPHNVSETSDTTSGDGSLGLAGTLTFTDPELGQTHSVDPFFRDAVWSGASSAHTIPSVTQAAIVSALQASLLNDSTGTGTGGVSWNFVLPDHLLDFLRAGETLTLTYNVITVRDSLDAVSSQPVTIVITGTNDRPAIEAPLFPIVSLMDEPTDSVPLTLTTDFAFFDVDLNDSHVVNAALIDGGAVWSGGPTVPFASLAALSIAMTVVVNTPSTHTGAGSLTWTFIGDNHFLDFLGAGETLTLTYAVSVVDDSGAANATSIGRNVTLVITGTNDGPVLGATTGNDEPVDGFAQPDNPEALQASGHLVATDADTTDTLAWTIVDGSTPHAPDYHFAIDQFTVTRIGSGGFSFVDNFDDSDPGPPDGPDFGTLTLPYGVNGGAFVESGGLLLMNGADSALIGNAASSATGDPIFGQFGTLRTSIATGSTAGLRSNTDFSVSGVFDPDMPGGAREAYGIRLSDRLIGGTGDPPDQPGNDVLEFAVTKAADGHSYVVLRHIDNDTHTTSVVASYSLDGYATINQIDQIRLMLSHDDAVPGQIHASFDLINDGIVDSTISFAAAGTIFSDENWTRAQFFSRAPEVSDTVKEGIYGTLTLTQAGAWTYVLNPDDPDMVLLAQGAVAHDTFDVIVSDGHAGVDTEPVTIEVTGANQSALTVATDSSYDHTVLYSAMVDADVGAIHDSTGFVAVGVTLPYSFSVQGFGFTYSGAADHPDIDAGVITGIDIYNSSSTLLASVTGLSIDITELDAAMDHYESSGGTDAAQLDEVFGAFRYRMTGGEGADILVGGNKNDVLIGDGGADDLTGKAGNDVVIGGAGDDIFRFEPGSGHDTIVGFVAGAGSEDVIRLGTVGSAFPIPTDAFGDVNLAAWEAQGGIEQSGSDVLLHLSVTSPAQWGGSTDLDTIRLQNVTIASLHVNDFSVVYVV